LRRDGLSVLVFLRLAEDRPGAFGNDESLDTLAALALELVLEALRGTEKEKSK